MTKYFSSTGLEIYKAKIAKQEKQVAQSSYRIGKAAGPSCDWHDNAEYDEARQQSEVEQHKLQEMKTVVQEAVVFGIKEQNKKVLIGNSVMYFDEKTKTKKEVTLGAFGEANIKLGIVLYESPIGTVLLEKQVGDTTTLQLGEQNVTIEIKKIYPPSYKYWSLSSKIK